MSGERETTEQTGQATEFRCAMGRWDDFMLMRPVGMRGMSFVFGDDPSVILSGADVLRLRDLLTARLEEAARG